jgi:YHS domain-containing protein
MKTLLPIAIVALGILGCGDDAPKTPPTAPPAAKPVPATQSPNAAGAQTQPAAFTNTSCPVSDETLGEHGKPVTVSFEGKTYGLCCDDCVAEFQKDPTRFAAKAK